MDICLEFVPQVFRYQNVTVTEKTTKKACVEEE